MQTHPTRSDSATAPATQMIPSQLSNDGLDGRVAETVDEALNFSTAFGSTSPTVGVTNTTFARLSGVGISDCDDQVMRLNRLSGDCGTTGSSNRRITSPQSAYRARPLNRDPSAQCASTTTAASTHACQLARSRLGIRNSKAAWSCPFIFSPRFPGPGGARAARQGRGRTLSGR